jgi:hypothetical protein
MSSLSRTACVLFAGLVLSMLPAVHAHAQEARTLTIQNGTVYIDGRALSSDRLPGPLALDGVQAHYRFLGIQEPVVEIGGQLYAVNETLEPVSEEEARRRNASVILQGGTQSPQALRPTREQQAAGTRAADLQQAHQQYLKELQQHSHSLYERIMRERRMEAETRELARVIRLLPEGPERQAQVDTLRATLNQIFELKQDNRLREIEQLQNQIMELQRSLQKRERMRQKMIDQRMKQLIGTEDEGASSGDQ